MDAVEAQPGGDGLTDPGRALVRACAELGILVDLSHLNQAGFLDVARLGASGPLVGVVFAVGFLRDDGAQEHAARALGEPTTAQRAAVPAGLPRVVAALRAAGFTEPELEQIAWANWRRVLAAWWR